MPERLHEKHFTLAEARSLLPRVRATVARIADAWRAAREGRTASVDGNGRHADGARVVAALARELADAGILLKDAERGLVDFPYLRDNGEEVYLCWLAGEEDILFWHRIEDGFAGRRPIADI